MPEKPDFSLPEIAHSIGDAMAKHIPSNHNPLERATDYSKKAAGEEHSARYGGMALRALGETYVFFADLGSKIVGAFRDR